ncbi:hypothetical protein Vi05172_g11058 [Venturia inaequalis]|uniref:Uncharacterized protein n=1 Tax=Venturia inaequalis TaxID=5025 RepID=A0A8H3VT54_VENIN|nr:hypothetical protein EG327_004350 [Venturia inaequalis]RDI78907.1 hypothetical protein Vi05172_g11058 [Venturia inaequalis]
MSNNSEQVKEILEQSEMDYTIVPPQLPGQGSTPTVTSVEFSRLPGRPAPSSDLRSEVQLSTLSNPPSSPQVPLSTRRPSPQPDNHLAAQQHKPSPSKMPSAGYAAATSASNLKSKLPRLNDDKPGNRVSKPVNETPEDQSTNSVQQPRSHRAEVSTDTPLTASGEFSAESSTINNFAASLSASNDDQAIIAEAEQSLNLGADYSLLSAATNNEQEPEGDGSSTTSHEDVVSQQGEWVDDEMTLVDDFLHASIAKVVEQDFSQSTRTVIDEGHHVTNFDDSITFQDDTQDPKSLDLSLDGIHSVKQVEEDLVGLTANEVQELMDKLNVAEEQIATLSAGNEQREKQIHETENRLRFFQQDYTDIIAEAKLKEQERDVVIDQIDTENKGLLVQVHEMTLAAQDLQKKYKLKCDECDELIAGANSEHPSELELKFVVAEMVRVREEHEKALEAAEARFEVERSRHAESIEQQDEIIQVQDGLVAQLENEVEEIRDSLSDAEGRAELKEFCLRQMDDDFAALQNAMTNLWRQPHDLGKPVRRQIARLEFGLRKARQGIEVVKAEAEHRKKNFETTIGELEADDSALREELGKLQYLYERLRSDSIREAEETKKLRAQLLNVEELNTAYLNLGSRRRTDAGPETYKPPKRLSHQQILASSDPTILAPALKEAWEMMRCYEDLKCLHARTPMEKRESNVVRREYEVIARELALVEKTEEVERFAGAANVEAVVLRDTLGEREKEIVHLKRVVRGLEDDIVHQAKARRVETLDEKVVGEPRKQVGNDDEKGTGKVLVKDDASYTRTEFRVSSHENKAKRSAYSMTDGTKHYFKDRVVREKKKDEDKNGFVVWESRNMTFKDGESYIRTEIRVDGRGDVYWAFRMKDDGTREYFMDRAVPGEKEDAESGDEEEFHDAVEDGEE